MPKQEPLRLPLQVKLADKRECFWESTGPSLVMALPWFVLAFVPLHDSGRPNTTQETVACVVMGSLCIVVFIFQLRKLRRITPYLDDTLVVDETGISLSRKHESLWTVGWTDYRGLRIIDGFSHGGYEHVVDILRRSGLEPVRLKFYRVRGRAPEVRAAFTELQTRIPVGGLRELSATKPPPFWRRSVHSARTTRVSATVASFAACIACGLVGNQLFRAPDLEFSLDRWNQLMVWMGLLFVTWVTVGLVAMANQPDPGYRGQDLSADSEVLFWRRIPRIRYRMWSVVSLQVLSFVVLVTWHPLEPWKSIVTGTVLAATIGAVCLCSFLERRQVHSLFITGSKLILTNDREHLVWPHGSYSVAKKPHAGSLSSPSTLITVTREGRRVALYNFWLEGGDWTLRALQRFSSQAQS